MSLEARVMFGPARAFGSLNRGPAPAFLAWRRPALQALVLACVVSLVLTGTLTARIVASSFVYWASVPLVQIVALRIVLARTRPDVGMRRAIDLFFAGNGPWLLLLTALAMSIALVSLVVSWWILTVPGMLLFAVVLLWSAWIDFHFFVHVAGCSRGGAWRRLLAVRAIGWTLVFAIVALPSMTPAGWAETFHEIGSMMFGAGG